MLYSTRTFDAITRFIDLTLSDDDETQIPLDQIKAPVRLPEQQIVSEQVS